MGPLPYFYIIAHLSEFFRKMRTFTKVQYASPEAISYRTLCHMKAETSSQLFIFIHLPYPDALWRRRPSLNSWSLPAHTLTMVSGRRSCEGPITDSAVRPAPFAEVLP